MKDKLILKTNGECDLSFKYPNPLNANTADEYSDIPIIYYSNGSVCWEATDYLLAQFDTNPSISKITLGTYASHLSRIVSYLEYIKLSIFDLTDANLIGPSGLVKYLQNPRYSKNGVAAGNNQVNKILSRLFSWLFYLQENCTPSSRRVISDSPTNRGQINVTILKHRPKKTRTEVNYYSHPARLESQSPLKRRPIQESAIHTLIESIDSFTENRFIRERWNCLLSIMEFTGARESEISKIKTLSVINAKENIKGTKSVNRYGLLEIETIKSKKKRKCRKIPIPELVIDEIYNYMLFTRNPLVNEAKRNSIIEVDHGCLFTTDDGRPLTGKRIYDHFREVRNISTLKPNEASPHLFRHRFITAQVRDRLRIFLDEKKFYTADIESFIVKKVKLLSGHVSDASLWGYVDDAMEELESFQEVEDQILNMSNTEAAKRKIIKSLSEAKSLKSPKEKVKALEQLLEFFVE